MLGRVWIKWISWAWVGKGKSRGNHPPPSITSLVDARESLDKVDIVGLGWEGKRRGTHPPPSITSLVDARESLDKVAIVGLGWEGKRRGTHPPPSITSLVDTRGVWIKCTFSMILSFTYVLYYVCPLLLYLASPGHPFQLCWICPFYALINSYSVLLYPVHQTWKGEQSLDDKNFLREELWNVTDKWHTKWFLCHNIKFNGCDSW